MKHIWGWKRKSIFYQILFSFCLLFLIFFLSCAVLYHISSRNLEKEIQASSYVLLQKAQQEMDDRIGAARTILEKVYMDTAFQDSVEQDRKSQLGMMNEYAMRKQLSAWQTKELADLFVWYGTSKRIVSGTYTSTDPAHYFGVYYQAPEFTELTGDMASWEAWRQGTEDASGALTAEEINGGSRTIFLSMNYPSGHTMAGGQAVITAVLQPTDVEEALNGLHDDGSLYVYNKEGRLLAFSGDWIDGIWIESQEENYYTETIAGEEYVIQKSQSEKSGMQYVHVIPEQVFWNRQREYVRTAAVFMAMFCLIGVLMIVWLSRANYQPWKKLVSSVKKEDESEFQQRKLPENEYLQEAFYRTISQKEDIYRKMQSQKKDEIENQLLKFLRSENEGSEFFELAGSEQVLPQGAAYMLAQFFIESWDRAFIQDLNFPQAANGLKKMISDLLKSTAGVGVSGAITVQLDRRRYLSLIALSSLAGQEMLSAAMTQLQVVMKKTVGVGSTVLLSDVSVERASIPELFGQVAACERYRNILGREILIPYASVEARKFGYRRDQGSIKSILQNWIGQKTEQYTETDVIRSVTENALDENTADVASFLLLKQDMKNVLILLAQENGLSKELQKQMEEALDGSASWLEYKMCCAKQLAQLKEYNMQSGQNKDLVTQVYEYIHENYSCEELGVNYLADQFHLSSQYLSRSFRARYQTGIIDEIARVRIAASKEALIEGKESVEVIALANGFLSSASFIRTFKKYEGITPGEFRSQNRAQQSQHEKK